MSQLQHPIVQLLREDPRYSLEAYQFIRDALSYGQTTLGMGSQAPTDDVDDDNYYDVESELADDDDRDDTGDDEDIDDDFDADNLEDDALGELDDDLEEMEESLGAEGRVEKHLTGQQLCDAVRHFATEQYGYMAKVVLNSWGIHTTSDFGEIVYNLIRIGMMKKSPTDRREDFDDCYDFAEAFQREYQITMPQD